MRISYFFGVLRVLRGRVRVLRSAAARAALQRAQLLRRVYKAGAMMSVDEMLMRSFQILKHVPLTKSYSTARDRTLPPPVRRLGSRSHRFPAPAAAALRCATCHLRGRRRLSSSAYCTFRMPPGWPHPRFCAYRTLPSRPQASCRACPPSTQRWLAPRGSRGCS